MTTAPETLTRGQKAARTRAANRAAKATTPAKKTGAKATPAHRGGPKRGPGRPRKTAEAKITVTPVNGTVTETVDLLPLDMNDVIELNERLHDLMDTLPQGAEVQSMDLTLPFQGKTATLCFNGHGWVLTRLA